MRYKFWFEVDIPDNQSSGDELKKLFQAAADAVQAVCPFDNNDWDFCVARMEC